MTHQQPPRLALRFLETFLPEESRDAVIGDIVERWEQDAAGRSFSAARFWREAVQAVVTMQFAPADSTAFEPAQRESLVQGFLSDLRRGARSLARAPGFTFVAVGTLAVAIGATATLISVANPLLFQVLPYSKPKQLVMLNERMGDGSPANIGYATYKDLRDASRSFAHAAAFGTWEPTLFGEQEGERLRGLRVSWEFFRTLGVQPALGRDFVREDDTPDNLNVVILSHSLWQRRFGGDPGIIGRTIDLATTTRPVVIGVLPASFENVLDPPSEIYRALGYATQPWACRTCRHLRAIGRLHDDVSTQQASRELNPMMQRMAADFPNTYPGAGVVVERLSDRVTRSTRAIFGVVIGAVVLLLLIAAANVVNLQLARAARREEEFAVRAALGAGRGRIARQLFAEGLVIAAAGGIAGVIVAALTLPPFVAMLPETLPRLASIGLDTTVLAVIALIVLFIAVAMGMFPAFGAGTRSLFAAIRAGGRSGGSPHHRTRSGIVVAEVALAMMLVIGATLLGRSMMHLLSVDLGFQPRGLVTMTFESSGPRYDSASKVFAHHDRVREAVQRVPGVTAVSLASQLPLGGNFDQYGVFLRERGMDEPVAAAQRYGVSWDYPRTMGMRIVRGRAFTEEEARDTAVRVALVSESMARRIAPDGDAMGKYLRIGGGERPWNMVVGVVADTRHEGVDDGAVAQVYMPERHWVGPETSMILVARVDGEASGFVNAVREAVRSVDPIQPISSIATMEQVVSRSIAQRRLGLILFVSFSAMALLLAGAGIFGVLAGAVTERTREFGVRTAFGATPGSIFALVLRQGGTLALGGLLIGGVGAILLSRYLAALLFEVKAQDPGSIMLGVGVVVVVALLACIVPARRATRTDPIVALRSD